MQDPEISEIEKTSADAKTEVTANTDVSAETVFSTDDWHPGKIEVNTTKTPPLEPGSILFGAYEMVSTISLVITRF